MKNIIEKRISESIEIKHNLLKDVKVIELIGTISSKIIKALKKNNKVIFAGNGGSFSDSFHLSGEFVSRFLFDRKALPSIALGGNNSILTAIGNDYSFDEIFSREIECLGNKGDIFIGISTSGNSENIIRAINIAKDKGIQSFVFTGRSGGKLKGLCECLHIPSESTARIQEAHIVVGHIICELVEKEMFRIN